MPLTGRLHQLRHRIADTPAAARVREWWQAAARHRLLSPITGLGWVVIVGGAISGVVGWLRGWAEFRSLAAMAAAILVISIAFTLRRSDHQVLLQLNRPRVQVGEEALGRIVVRAAGQRGSGAARLEMPVGRAVASFRVAAMGADDEHEELFAIPTRRRGVIALGPVHSVQADPLGVISRTKQLTQAEELFIHPKLVALEAGAIGVLKDVEGITTANLSSSDVSFHALREYVPGDDRRAIHWRTTARMGRLMVRQFEETMRAHLLIMLSTRVADYETPDDFEMAVSTAGSLGVAAMREERQVSLHTSTGAVSFPSAIGLLDQLCRIDQVERGLDTRSMAVEAGAESGISVACFVTGHTPAATLRGAQLALPPGISSFAVRCVSGQPMARHQVGDLTSLDVGQLDQVPLVVASLS